MIETASISKNHGKGASQVAALSGVSLTIARGEFVALVGPSGSGKSTLMNLIGLLDRPSTGEVYVDGTPTSGLNTKQLAAIRSQTIGFVFQSFHLLPRLTAWQNVALPLRYRGMPRQEREDRARHILARFGLAARASHRPDELSGGQRQRVAISRALVGRPRIILADEPTGNLDSQAAADVLSLFTELNEAADPVTIIMVTHDQGLAARCSRVVHLLDGRVISDLDAGAQRCRLPSREIP